jgi:DNA polymerase-3 subunit delta
MDSIAFLDKPFAKKPQPIYVLYGDEDFLKRQVLVALRESILGPGDTEFSLSTYAGDDATFATVHDELWTLPFIGPRRLVSVERADPFITKYRAALEKYVAEPAQTGTLVLEVKSWPATTRLAKMVPPAGSIACKAPAAYRLPEWCARWAQTRYERELPASAARLLVDLIGAEMGQLDQELAKLSTFVGTGCRIDIADVDRLVGSSRTENTFKIFDAMGSGNAKTALAILDRALTQGEDPIRILGAFSMQLRRLVQASRLHQQGLSLGQALDSAGVPPFARQGSEQQLRHLGPRRVGRLLDWLVEADLGMKGGSQLSPQILLERLLVRLAASNDSL